MDTGKRRMKFNSPNAKIYMDLKDIIREHALQFLPAKSVLRCRSVCRDWKLVISSPFFAHNQTLSFRGLLGIFCQTKGESTSFISLDPKAYGIPDPSLKFLPEPVHILSSSNGLICCQGREKDKAYYICNPVTKQWKKLPKPNSDHGADPAIVLVFEPSLLNFVADYKLICVFKSSDFDPALEFEIYSSAEGSWRVCGEICFGNKKIFPSSGVYVNGMVYWLTSYGIVSFDMMNERLVQISGHGPIAEVNGKLCSFTASSQGLSINMLTNIHSNTMGMHKMGNLTRDKTWTRIGDIQLNSPISLGTGGSQHELFLGGDMLVLRNGSSVIAHDMKTKETKTLLSNVYNQTRLIPYHNNLVYF